MSEIITVARLNNLQSRIALILGNGSGDRGYGQPLSSSQIINSPTTVIRAEHINNLFTDLMKARTHQVGYTEFSTGPLRIAKLIQNVSAIGLQSSSNVVIDSQSGQVSLVDDPQSTFRGIADYEVLMGQIESDKFLAHSTQMTLQSAIQSVRTTPWNGIIFHEFTVNFSNADQRRYFFNSGGKINFNTNLLNPNGTISEDWTEFLASIGPVSFEYTQTTSQHGNSLIGNYDLTSSYQKIFEIVGGGTVTSVPSKNVLSIYAKSISSSAISFKVEFSDLLKEFLISGRLESTISYLQPTGVFAHDNESYTSVSLPAPTFSTLVGLPSFLTPVSVFSLYTNKTSVVNNDTFRITLNTSNVLDSTPVPYTITGVTSQDINGESLTGSLIVNANTSFKNFTTASTISQNKTFNFSLNNLPNSVNVIFNQTAIPLPTSSTITCISVIDESSVDAATIRNTWLAFRQSWPNRPFYLLHPRNSGGSTDLKIPLEFRTDPLAFYSIVTRDNGVTAKRSNWYNICNLQSVPNNAKVTIWLDSSGSMTLDTVRASYNFMLSQLTARNIELISNSDGSENWVRSFNRIF